MRDKTKGFIIYEYAKKIFNNDEQFLYEIIEKECNDIEYIDKGNEKREHAKEVNECYYIFLASLCYSVTLDEIKLNDDIILESDEKDYDKEILINVNNYCNLLKDINKILQNLNNDLYICLNEMYIIDDLIKIIELQNLKNKDLDKIQQIRNLLRESALIIQKNQPNKITELITNFLNINDSLTSKEIKNEENKDYIKKYYETLKYIYLKEINKINDINYRSKILEKIIVEKEIIKISNDIFQIIFKKLVKTEKGKFKQTIKDIKKGEDEKIIVELIENNLANDQNEHYFALSETILYFFEKNSLIYLNNTLYDKKEPALLEGEPLEILKDCIKYLNEYNFNYKKITSKIKHITKLICLAYIRVYCYIFIKMLDDEFNSRIKDPSKIIDLINNHNLKDMIKYYIYKIIFYQNKNQLNIFSNTNIKEKYKLDKYKGFNDFIKFTEGIQVEFDETIDKDNYKYIYKIILDGKKEDFKNKIDIPENEKNEIFKYIDNFYVVSYNLILNNLKKLDYENTEIYINFYNNICKPLFEKEEKQEKLLFEAIQIIFNREKFEEIKNEYEIDSFNIAPLLYGYRYCLNELNEEKTNGIYSSLYNGTNIDYLNVKFYPGSDTKNEPYYELLYKIEKHLKERPNDGCYVCLCNKGFYHSVPSGFPGLEEKNNKCPNCHEEIGTKEIKNEIKIVKRRNYYRIFKDNNEKDELPKEKKKKLEDINCMTLDEFKEKYIKKLFDNEKGLPQIDKNFFRKEDKYMRGLNPITYRLLNYILYSHLFFAKLLTKSNRFDKCLPKNIKWGEILNESWALLEKELKNKEIKSIEVFMNFIFKDLFTKLHDEEIINKYEELISFEEDIESIIEEKIRKSQDEYEKYKELINNKSGDKESSINLLKEEFEPKDYPKEKYPFYENFYYTDYLDEKYISHQLELKDKNKYLILNYYLEYIKNKKGETKNNKNKVYKIKKKNENKNDKSKNKDNISKIKKKEDKSKNKTKENIAKKKDKEDKIKDIIINDNLEENMKKKLSLDELNLFNTVLNLFIEKYSHQISRKFATNKVLKDDEIYQTKANIELIDKFIKFYNSLKIQDSEEQIITLSIDNKLSDFFLDSDNKYGKSYIDIYKAYIEKQNKSLEELLQAKIISGEFNCNCTDKINIQQIQEDEIFTLKIPKKFSFTNLIFNSSYRKIIDDEKKDYKIYKDYFINFNFIENNITDLLLKNKKLLNNDISEFIYNEEIFNNEINNLFNSFKKNYEIENINIDDKVVLYNFVKDHKDLAIYKEVINNFITVFRYLNKLKSEQNVDNNIKGTSIIYEINEQFGQNISKEFISIFKDKKELIVKKIFRFFYYYLKLIYKYVKEEIEKYQEKLDEEQKKKINNFFIESDENNSKIIISKEDFATSIRLFITLILFREEDKKSKIKDNMKNIVNYLKEPDLWDDEINKDENFNENLNKIKSFNIQINQILELYKYLIKDNEENFSKEVEEYLESLKKKKEEYKNSEEIKSDKESDNEENKDSDSDKESLEKDSKGSDKEENSKDDDSNVSNDSNDKNEEESSSNENSNSDDEN